MKFSFFRLFIAKLRVWYSAPLGGVVYSRLDGNGLNAQGSIPKK
jgi:hypothetical protein